MLPCGYFKFAKLDITFDNKFSKVSKVTHKGLENYFESFAQKCS